MSEDLEPIRRVEIYFNDDREEVELKEATWKYVTLFDEEGEIEEQYSVDIIDGVDPEHKKKLKNEEGFNEEDHPRDNDGVFVDKGGGSSSQSKTIRDRVLDRETAMHERRIKKLEERIPKVQALLDDPDYKPTNDMDSKDYLEYSMNRMKNNVIKYTELKENSMKNSKLMKEKYDGLNLLEMSGVGNNTHEVGSRGFKNGSAKSLMRDWKLEMQKGTYLTKRENERYDEDDEHEDRLISVKEWDNRFKGKTLIESNIPQNDDGIKGDMQNEIMFFWNEVMTDQQRSGVDVLKIYWSDNPAHTMRHGSQIRTLGTHSGRKGYTRGKDESKSEVLLAPSVLTINLSRDDSLNDVINTMIHENSHSQWSNNVKTDWKKTNAFTEKILALGQKGAITEYAGSYFDDLEKAQKENEGKWEEFEDRIKNHTYGRNDVQTDKEYADWKNTQILQDLSNRHKSMKHDIRENVAKVERLIANETHSEYFAMVSAPTEKAYHTVDTVKLQAMSKLIKEGLYD